MANIKDPQEVLRIKRRVLLESAKLFLGKGYVNATTREIAQAAGISKSMLMYTFKSKEDVLCELVNYVLEEQFTMAGKMLSGVTDDKILFYAVETTLQLYMAESSESVRELYAAAYSMPKTSDIIQQTITAKLEVILREHLPELETKDFYELEIATGGIMRSFMARPCDMYFTMDRKVSRFLQSTFRVFGIPEEKIREAIRFVSRFDYPTIARSAIEAMLCLLDERTAPSED